MAEFRRLVIGFRCFSCGNRQETCFGVRKISPSLAQLQIAAKLRPFETFKKINYSSKSLNEELHFSGFLSRPSMLEWSFHREGLRPFYTLKSCSTTASIDTPPQTRLTHTDYKIIMGGGMPQHHGNRFLPPGRIAEGHRVHQPARFFLFRIVFRYSC